MAGTVFRADRTEVFEEILDRDPKPPRQVSDLGAPRARADLPECLSKRMADRYETAGDLADDLKTWLVAEASTDHVCPLPRGRRGRPRARPAARDRPQGPARA